MSLGLLYAKAAVTAIGPRSATLPDKVLRRSVAIDRGHLAAYDRVCGFRFGDALPVPYLHVLGFAQQIELMASRSFPFALPGLVHVRNAITMHRTVDAAETLAISVHAERLRGHPKGAQVDLVTAVDAAAERVFDGRSTYFARGASAPDGTAEPPGPQPFDDGPPDATWHVDAATGRRYAGVSGDVNPIHLSPLAAKAFGFPRAIAHGMWTAAHALAALDGRLPGALTWDVEFGKPLLLPSTVELRTKRIDDGWALDVRSGKPHLAATVRAA
jgi:acyl dehydratase